MTWIELAKRHNCYFTNDEIDYLLKNRTAYPFADLKIVIKQFLSALRAYKNKLILCELCNQKLPYHKKGCIAKRSK